MKNLVSELASSYDFDTTVATIVSEAESREWSVPAVHDLQQSLAKAGKTVKPVKVIEICKPAYSGRMLELNHERIISVMMPCRISVYMKDDGITYVALINADELSSGLQPEIADVMKQAADEVAVIVQKTLR